MDELDQIEQKYSFTLPQTYRSMFAVGWLDVKSPDPLYFWLLGAEWLSPAEILEYEPEDYQKPGFVPFAAEADGSHWCWWPEAHPETVVLCPRDCYDGEFYAPSFLGFVYCRLLDYAGCVSRQEEQEARQHLYESTVRLANYFPDAWKETLNTLASAELVQLSYSGRDAGWGLMTHEQKLEILQRDVSFPLQNQNFQWMYPLTEAESETAALYRKISLEADRTRPAEEVIAQLEAVKAQRRNET